MTPADLSRCVVSAVRCAVEDGELGGAVPARVVVERTRPGGVGEYATPVAFQIAKGAGVRPAEVAEVLARRLGAVAGIERVEITGAGFLNFSLASVSAAQLVRDLRPVAGAAAAVEVPDPSSGELRERLVRAAVARIAAAQGVQPGPAVSVAPVARRDGDVLARYGADAVAWAVLTTPPRETPEFCDALLVQGESNELFRVRYAHARAHALVRNAEQLGFRPEPGEVDAPALLRVLADHPLVLEAAAHHRAPERLARHLVELADALLDFQHRVLPKGDEKPSAAHRARLALAEAAGTVLAGGLALLGIDAPTRL
ncbi:DALR anticodon-binding domain-containing protein [Streptomyces sp. NBC_01214]|uniref:ArgS-related anticodon-binding protein NrtL n=1 Tax=Streptomyces sp. NBC_01214 TaxID=2903777 RepID=UPI00224FBCF0|nr:DALR anticodon-binding domain-containing protein [Streptomyces sp. NBC_01214]MCX4805767.1 DALR anticodon-binding domain-containing protein [Streptomyces sp. NBC_01214]